MPRPVFEAIATIVNHIDQSWQDSEAKLPTEEVGIALSFDLLTFRDPTDQLLLIERSMFTLFGRCCVVLGLVARSTPLPHCIAPFRS